MKAIEEIRQAFLADRFAAGQGMEIESVADGGAVCCVEIMEEHRNAMGAVQGGLIFTLADFTFAVATNWEELRTVTLNSTIHYLKPSLGSRLTATAVRQSKSRTICLYEIDVVDDQGTDVARIVTTGYTKPR